MGCKKRSVYCKKLPKPLQNTQKSGGVYNMKKSELRKVAKQVITDALAVAYYKVVDEPDSYELSEDEANEVVKYMGDYCRSICKQLGTTYYTM